MKILRFTKILALFGLLAVLPTAKATTLYPYLGPIRTEITNQLTVVSNNPPVDLKKVAVLKAGLKSIDRVTTTNLTIDLATLNILMNGVGRSSLSNTFLPLIDTAAENYFNLIADSYATLTNRLSNALPSAVHTAADKSLASLLATLQKASTNDLRTAIKLISQAGAKLKSSTTLVTRAEAVLPGPNSITAKINGVAYAVRGLLGPGHPTGVMADYNSSTHILTITSAKIGTTGGKMFTVQVGSMAEGTTVHSFGGSTVASYSVFGIGANGTSNSSSGTLTVTLNSAKKVASGSFSFNISGTAGNGPVTGTFVVNL